MKDFPCELVVRKMVALTQLSRKGAKRGRFFVIRECMICIREYIYKLFALLNVAR